MGDSNITDGKAGLTADGASSVWTSEIHSHYDAHKRPEKKALTTPQNLCQNLYEDWYKAVQRQNLTFAQTYALAQKYCTKYDDSRYFHNAAELKTVKDWLKAQDERPCVILDLSKVKSSGKNPSPEEIGLAIGQTLGFNQSEMALFAAEKGVKTPGAAFYASSGREGNYFLDEAQKDPLGRVKVGEMVPGSIAEMKAWLKEYRQRLLPNPILGYDWAKERSTGVAIETHLVVPAAGFAGGVAGGVGDIVKGVGLPLHLFSSHTFMDSAADYLAKTAAATDLTALYTPSEQSDAGLALLNIYTRGIGGVAPMMVPGMVAARVAGGAGEASEVAGMIARTSELSETAATGGKAHEIAGEIIGAASGGGQVYDASVTTQARTIALQERKYKSSTDKEIADRIQEIKEGKNIDPQVRQEIELRALGAAAIAAPAGAVYGRWINNLSASTGAAFAPSVEESAALAMRNEATKGTVLGLAQLVSNEESQVVFGVKRQADASQAINDQILETALSSAAVGGSLAGVAHAAAARKEHSEGLPPEATRESPQAKETPFILDPAFAIKSNGNVEASDKSAPHSKVLQAVPQLVEHLTPLITDWTSNRQLTQAFDFISAQDERLWNIRTGLADALDLRTNGKGRDLIDNCLDDKKIQAEIVAAAPELKSKFQRYLKEAIANENTHEQLDAAVEQRRGQLENQLNSFAAENNLPTVHIAAVDDNKLSKGTYAAYAPGTGTIVLRKSTLLSTDSVAAVVGSVCHELTHAEQEALGVRFIADQLQVGQTPTAAEREQMKTRFAERGLGTLTDDRLNNVMERRNGQPLTDEGAARALQLQQSMAEVKENNEKMKAVETELKRLETKEKTFDFSASFFLRTMFELSDNSRRTYFGDRPVPAEITTLIEQVRANKPVDEAQAKATIATLIFATRRAELTAEAQKLNQTYKNFRHEQEAYAVSRAVNSALPTSAHTDRSEKRNRDLLRDIFAAVDGQKKEEPETGASNSPTKPPKK